jgi:hypothetical protein
LSGFWSPLLFLSAVNDCQERQSYIFSQTVCPHKIVRLHGLFTMTANGLQLSEEADFEALNCLPALNLIRSKKLHLSTEPAFLPNAC